LGVTFFGTKSTKYFGDLPAALFTLFICITQDGWLGIFRELKEEGQYVAAAIYFTSFIMIGAFVFANLVVAVVVTNLVVHFGGSAPSRTISFFTECLLL
jgi:cation channel sperm-associated protein 4